MSRISYQHEIREKLTTDFNNDGIANLLHKFGRERDYYRDRLAAVEAPESGQGLRVGSRVHRDGSDVVGTIIRIVYDWDSEESWRPRRIDVRFEDGHICDFSDEDEISELVDVTPRVYLNVYLHDRAWGGPEEGGWWFDTYEHIPDESTMVKAEDVDAELAKKRQWCQEQNKSRNPPWSVVSEGHFVAHLEAWPGTHQPIRKPQYC